MKKLLILILVLLTSFSCVTFSSGCKKSEESGLREGLFAKQMLDFESKNELMSVRLTAHEAQIFHNSDKKLVSSGEKSMKIHVNQAQSAIGYYEDTVMQFIPGQQYFSQTDFSKVVGIGADIWNDNNFEVEMCFSLNNKAVIIDYMKLKPGYNKVEFIYDNNQVISFTDRQLLSMDFSFYSPNGNEVIYIDNVSLIFTEAEYKPYDFTANYKDNLAFGYENYAESITTIDLGGFDSLFSRARTSINKDKRFISQGEGSLRVEFFKSPKDKLVDNTVIRTYDKILPNFDDYVDGDWSLAVDIFNATDKTLEFELKIFATVDDETCSIKLNVPANSWADKDLIKMPISLIKEYFTSEQIKVLTVVYGFNGVDAGDVVYIDNLRFERGAV